MPGNGYAALGYLTFGVRGFYLSMISFNHQVFLAVAQYASFTKASEALFISQPAVSKHIKQLEEYYKSALFERNGKTILLTEAGKVLHQHLLAANDISKQIEFDLASLNGGRQVKGELKLGASTTVALYIIPQVLSAFRKRYPDVKISLLNRNSENVLNALLAKEIDLAIIEGAGKRGQVSTQHFITDEVVPVCSSKSPVAQKQTYSLAELLKAPVALRERGSGTLVAIKSSLAKKGFKLSQLDICMRLGGTEALKNFLLADECIGFLPLKAVAKELQYGELTRLFVDGFSIVRQFYFVRRHGEEANGLNNSFARFALSYYNQKL